MKKFFLFAAVAGMLASCSSESLTGSDPNIDPSQQDDRVPIEIGVATPQLAAQGATRGMGTVGDVVGNANNFWQGEKVNVFMFKKGTLEFATEDGTPLYNDVALTTPAGRNSDVAVELAGNVITYKYYPIKGNFDFWGYFIDDASGAHAEVPAVPYADVDEYNADHDPDITAGEFDALPAGDKVKTPAIPAVEAVTIGTEEVTVPFRIDGSQDLMVAKTVIDVDGADNAAVTAIDAADNNDDTKVSPTREHSTRYYSAFAARRGLQPNLNFQHLLTRLTFSIYGADNETCGFVNKGAGVYGLPVDGSTFEGVFVKSIKVKSKATGKIIAAYTGDPRTPSQLISFDNTGGPGNNGYYDLFLKSKRNPVASTNPVTPLYPAAFDWDNKNDIRDTKLKIDDDDSGENANWKYILRPETTDAGTANTIGGALMVSPEPSYDLEIEIGQCLLKSEELPLTNPSTNPTYEVRYATFPYTITPTPVGDPATTQGVSYNVKIKLYGFEKIEITTTLEAWKSGDDITFDVE